VGEAVGQRLGEAALVEDRRLDDAGIVSALPPALRASASALRQPPLRATSHSTAEADVWAELLHAPEEVRQVALQDLVAVERDVDGRRASILAVDAPSGMISALPPALRASASALRQPPLRATSHSTAESRWARR
jgi:hypothetical protein